MATQQRVPALAVAPQTSPSNPESHRAPLTGSLGASTLYGGAIKLDFDAKGHTYTVTDLTTMSIREVPSVTEILEVIGTCKWPLKQWAANMTADYIKAAIRPGLRYDELQIEQIIEQARKNFHTVSRGAKTIGTLDVVGDVDGQIAVVDWKTSKAIYDEMPLQAAAYAQAWAEMYDERIPDRWVIRLDKETGEFEPVRFPRETFRRDLRGFLAAKTLHLTVEAMKRPAAPRKPKAAAAISVATAPRGPMAPEPARIPPLAPRKPAPQPAPQPAPTPAPRQPEGCGEIVYRQAGNVLVLSGATFPIRHTLKNTFRASPRRKGDAWEWQAPAGCLDALAGFCNRTGIRLVPVQTA